MNTVFLPNGLYLKPKKCSGAADTVDRVSAKCSRLLDSSYGNSSLVTILIVGMIFNCIQMTTPIVISSTYDGSLSYNSPIFVRPEGSIGSYYYYQAIRITVYITGRYTFTSDSSWDTYGCFYNNPVDPSNPTQNLIACNDDSGGDRQFQIDVTLQYQGVYILIVTTSSAGMTGSFSIKTIGPEFFDLTSFTPSTSRPIKTTTTTSPAILSTYSDYLSSSGPVFTRPNGSPGSSYYYKAVRVTAFATGTYTFKSDSSVDTYGCFYNDSIDPSNLTQNLIACDDDSGGDHQFRINVSLQYQGVYILIVTTYSADVTGSFSIRTAGPGFVGLTSFTPSTSRPIETTVTTTTPPATLSTYSGYFSSSSPVFTRPNGAAGSTYYYQALRVTALATGTYTFTSDSSVDTYGCLYNDSIDPSNPTENLMKCDDDAAGNKQFRISVTLQYERIYVLIVTTYSACEKGSFEIKAIGPDFMRLVLFTPSSNGSISTPTSSCSHEMTYQIGHRYSPGDIRTFMIVPSIWLGIFCICGICICRHRRQRNCYQPLTSPAHASNMEETSFHGPNNNENRIPYTIPLPIPTPGPLEGLAPNYETALSHINEQEQRNLIHF